MNNAKNTRQNDPNPNEVKPNRLYKSRIFEMVFSDKTELLKLYNAMNGTNYEDSELLEINTLEKGIEKGKEYTLQLTLQLLKAGRTEDIARAAMDENFCQSLYKEFHII